MPLLLSLAALTNASLLIIIALIHIYWALGGKAGIDHAIPSTGSPENDQKTFQPGTLATAVVALGLLLMAYICLAGGKLIDYGLSHQLLKYSLWGMALIFLLRAIGDFKYVGMFKKIKHTVFARSDSRYYIILCLLLSTNCALLASLR